MLKYTRKSTNTIENITIIGISETQWKTTGYYYDKDNNFIISSSNEQDSINYVAIIINKNIKNTVL